MTDATTAPREELLVKRYIDAPLELIWKTWTEPEHVRRWWGPKYYTCPSAKIDLRVGGMYIFSMRAPDGMGGQESFTAGQYQRILPLELLEFSQYLSDAQGQPIDPASIGMPPDFPRMMQTRVQFKAKGELTQLTISTSGWTASPMFVFAYAGMHQSMDKLDAQFGR